MENLCFCCLYFLIDEINFQLMKIYDFRFFSLTLLLANKITYILD